MTPGGPYQVVGLSVQPTSAMGVPWPAWAGQNALSAPREKAFVTRDLANPHGTIEPSTWSSNPAMSHEAAAPHITADRSGPPFRPIAAEAATGLLGGLGRVEAIGPNVTELQPGDYVVATVRRPGSSIYDRIGTYDTTTGDVYSSGASICATVSHRVLRGRPRVHRVRRREEL